MAMSIITTQVDGKQGLEKGIFFVSEWTNADKKMDGCKCRTEQLGNF